MDTAPMENGKSQVLLNVSDWIRKQWGTIALWAVAVIVLVSGIVYLRITTSRSISPISDKSAQANIPVNPTSKPVPNGYIPPQVNTNDPEWNSESFTLTYGSFATGRRTVTVNLEKPRNWTINSVSPNGVQNPLSPECPKYIIEDEQKNTSLTIQPVCSGWKRDQTDLPAGALTIVLDQKRLEKDGMHKQFRIKYNTGDLTYAYADVITAPDKTSLTDKDKILDGILISLPHQDFNTDHFFVPARVSAKVDSNMGFLINMPHLNRIVSSLRLQ